VAGFKVSNFEFYLHFRTNSTQTKNRREGWKTCSAFPHPYAVGLKEVEAEAPFDSGRVIIKHDVQISFGWLYSELKHELTTEYTKRFKDLWPCCASVRCSFTARGLKQKRRSIRGQVLVMHVVRPFLLLSVLGNCEDYLQTTNPGEGGETWSTARSIRGQVMYWYGVRVFLVVSHSRN
jgi:hypothetical protein